MISVANDLLNNSLGLCFGTDGRPNTYMDMFTGRLVHTCALAHLFMYLYAYIQIFVDTRTHTHQRSFDSLSFSPAVDTRGASRQRRPCFLIPPSSPLAIWTEKKVTRYFYLQPSWLSILISCFFSCITLDLFSMCLYFKRNCQVSGILMQLYYSQIIDHSKQRSTVRV